MTLINLPQTESISQINSRVSQAGLANVQADRIRADQARQEAVSDQNRTLSSLKMQGLNDPKARAIAIQLDPDYGMKLQNYEAAKQDYEAKDAVFWGQQTAAAAQAPLASRPSLYNNIYEKAKASGKDISMFPLPSDEWTEAHQGALEYISQQAIEPAKQLEMRQERDIEKQRLAKGVNQPSSVREYEYYNKLSPKEQQDFMKVKRDIYKTGLTSDEQGNVIVMPGVGSSKRELKQQESFGTALGKDIAVSTESLLSAESKIPELEATVKELGKLGKIATYTKAGIARDNTLRQLGRPMTKGGIARAEYISMVDNQVLPLLRDTFGAAFTEREGQTLRATLGDPDASPSEKQAKLNAFIKQKKSSIDSMRRKLGKESQSNNVQDLKDLSDEDLKKQLGL